MSKEVILTKAEIAENELLNNAIAYALEQHKGGLRKGTNIPYIVHPLEVMNILFHMGADKKLMAAGVLHDTVEDTTATLEDIAEKFGQEVADLVASHTEKNKSLPWRKRKELALEHLAHVGKREQMLVLADKISNIEAMANDLCKVKEKLWERFNQGKKQQEWYYRKAVEMFELFEDDIELMSFYQRFKDAVDFVFDPENEAAYFYEQLAKLVKLEEGEGALKNLQMMAEHNMSTMAMIALAEAYEGGMPCVEKDLEASFKWWHKAAAMGHPVAQYNCGKYYENGKGVDVDKHEALGYYFRAAQQGNVEAMNDIGIYYAEGIVVVKNPEEAFFWFKRASEDKSYAGALYNLASCYETGFGTEVDLAEADRLKGLADKLVAEGQEDYDWTTVGDYASLIEEFN